MKSSSKSCIATSSNRKHPSIYLLDTQLQGNVPTAPGTSKPKWLQRSAADDVNVLVDPRSHEGAGCTEARARGDERFQVEERGGTASDCRPNIFREEISVG